MTMNLKNKIIIVTGGARGIGYEISDRYLEKGAKVIIILDVNERGKIAADDLSKKYGENRAVFYKCDVAQDLENTWKEIMSDFKYVDVLVNDAANGNEDNVENIFDVNIKALVKWSLKAWEHMRTDKGGKGGTIINISSVFGYRPDPFCPLYKTSKYAVMGFTRSLGHTFNSNRSGVRVVALCPGYTSTGMSDRLNIWEAELIEKEFFKYINSMSIQNVEAVGKAAVEVFENAPSGTAWEIEGAKPIIQV